MATVIKFKAESFRKLPDPYRDKNETVPQMYTAICDVKDLPHEFLDWMETNPRKQNLKGRVGKKIATSLLTGHDFHLLNRGILISAENVTFNNYDNIISVTFDDPETHGNVDGGHTLKVILEHQDDLNRGQQFVKLEILTGVEGFFEDLAEARNTSTQVKDESIANLKDYYEMIKSTLKNEPYFGRINYMENDDGDIEVTDILAIMNMFNIDRYKGMDDCPINSYSSKKKCSDIYIAEYEKVASGESEESKNPYYKMLPLLPDFIKLYDKLEDNIDSYYRKKVAHGKYGSISGVTVAKEGKLFETKFYQNSTKYSTPKGFLYPILGSFRALLVEGTDGKYKWKKDPYTIMDKIGSELVNSTIERSRNNGNNPNKTGKDVTFWPTLYMRVMVECMISNT